MKYLILVLSLSFISFGFSQTKLINHKSHSGSNTTFKPNELYGNFGIHPGMESSLRGEIHEDKSSKYKFFYDSELSDLNSSRVKILTLVEIDDKEANELRTTKVLEKIRLKYNSEFLYKIELMLIEKLKAFRKEENK